MAPDGLNTSGLKALGDFIRSQRNSAQLSLREMAAKANVSNPYLSQIERGLHEPSMRVLRSIAVALNLSAETLLAQAGILESAASDEAELTPAPAEGAGHRPDTLEVLRSDPELTEAQRSALVAVYRSYVDANRTGEPPKLGGDRKQSPPRAHAKRP